MTTDRHTGRMLAPPPSLASIYLFPVNSSSHVSQPKTVSGVETTASPNGTVTWVEWKRYPEWNRDQPHPPRHSTHLACDVRYDPGQIELLRLPDLGPGREPAHLSVITIHG